MAGGRAVPPLLRARRPARRRAATPYRSSMEPAVARARPGAARAFPCSGGGRRRSASRSRR